MRRKHWSEFPDETVYGFHKYGIGVYKIDSKYNEIEWWLDWELSLPSERSKYIKYLKDNGLEHEIPIRFLEDTDKNE